MASSNLVQKTLSGFMLILNGRFLIVRPHLSNKEHHVNWIIVKKVSLETDLSSVNAYLSQQGVVHQIYEEGGEQVIAVKDPQIVENVSRLLEAILKGEVHIEARKSPQNNSSPQNDSLFEQIKASPVSSILIFLSVIGTCIVSFDSNNKFVHWLSFQNFSTTFVSGRQFLPFQVSISNGEIWRLLTPVFLHFGFFHVLFNSMWMWELGRRLEFLLGKKWYILLFVFTAIASNVAQHLWLEASLFGGMSGVVYALVGFIIVSHKLTPHPMTSVAPGVLVFMLVWLVFCMSGVVDNFISGSVANAAHVGGLIAGVIFAFVAATLKKLKVS